MKGNQPGSHYQTRGEPELGEESFETCLSTSIVMTHLETNLKNGTNIFPTTLLFLYYPLRSPTNSSIVIFFARQTLLVLWSLEKWLLSRSSNS